MRKLRTYCGSSPNRFAWISEIGDNRPPEDRGREETFKVGVGQGMAVWFVFSDEAGDYRKSPSARFLRAHPYFIRAGVMIKGDNWPLLRDAQ